MSDRDTRENEYEDVCMICHRPESKAGRMFHLPPDMCVCDDCMHRMLDMIGNNPMFSNPDTIGDALGSFPFGSMFGGNPFGDAFSMQGQTDDDDDFDDEDEYDDSDSKSAYADEDGDSDSKSAYAKEVNELDEKPARAGDGDESEDQPEQKPDKANTKKKKKSGNGSVFPGIRFVNLSDLDGMQGRSRIKKKPEGERKPIIELKDIPAPHKLKAMLDEYVVGQEHAKKIISVAVYNHYKRVATDTNSRDEIDIEKSNMLMIGPTGSGKTYLVKTLAKILNVPLAIADATSLTEAGYIGDDIESVVSKLLAAADNDVDKAEQGIIYIDEIDKIARKKETTSRDVSGESVQQGMLKLLEGSEIEVPVGASSKNAMVPLATVNTKNILFICGGAFPDLEDIIKQRMSKTTSIGYNAQLKDEFDKEKNILGKVTVEDLRKFGMIPEFLGRLPIIYSLEGLDEEKLIKILKEPKNAILKQYQKLLELDEVQLLFDDEALEAIAKKAMEKDTGARALRAIIEEFMLDIMYEIPKDSNIGRVTITKAYIEGTGGPIIDIRSNSLENPDNLNQIHEPEKIEQKVEDLP